MYTWTGDMSATVWLNDKFDTVEECIQEAKANGFKPGDKIMVGECVDVEIGGAYLVNLLADVEEDMFCEVGDVSED